MAAYFWIAVGSALGGMARYWCSGVAARLIGETFPYGTLIVNVVGSFIIGFIATITGPNGRLFVPSLARQFVMVGFCGGYTHLLVLQPFRRSTSRRMASSSTPASTSARR
jgi:fluoride exporter